MATKNAAFRNGQADYFGEQFNGGQLRLLAGNSDVLAVISLQNPAFGAATNGVIEALGLPLDFTGTAAAGSGTDIASALLISSNETQQISGLTVGTASAHVILDNVNIAEGQNGSLDSFSITIPETLQNPA